MRFDRSDIVRTDPENKNNHTNRRVYMWSGEELLTMRIDRACHRQPPLGFTVEWTTNKADSEILDAALDVYLQTRKLSLPKDLTAKRAAKQIRSQALKQARKLARKGFLDVSYQELREHQAEVEPLRVSLFGNPPERNLFYYSAGKSFDRIEFKSEFATLFPNPDLMFARIEWPLGIVEFDGLMEGSDERRIAMSTRYRIVRDVLEFFRSTALTPLTDNDVSKINRRLRMTVRNLPRPAKAGE